jgi:aspartate/methionine/tyrosine aminotransferase
MVKAWIQNQDIFEWVQPSGGVVCFPRIKPASGVNIDAFYHVLNEKYKTFVGPGHWFGMERNYMRVGFGWPNANELEEGLQNLSQAAEEAR